MNTSPSILSKNSKKWSKRRVWKVPEIQENIQLMETKKLSGNLCPVCHNCIDGVRTVRISDDVITALIESNRLNEAEYGPLVGLEWRKRVVICERHFNIPPDVQRVSYRNCLLYLKVELEDRRDWQVDARATSFVVQEKRRRSMELEEAAELERRTEENKRREERAKREKEFDDGALVLAKA